MVGEDDPIVPHVNGRVVASRCPTQRSKDTACGHLFVFTRPGETARRVETFMDQTP